jgi:hypothetical protein
MYQNGSNTYTPVQIANYNAYLLYKGKKHAKKHNLNNEPVSQIMHANAQHSTQHNIQELNVHDRENEIEMQKKQQEHEKQITDMLDNEFRKIYSLQGAYRLHYLRSKKFVKEFKEEHNYSLSVVLLENYTVKKTMKHTKMGHYMLNNEIKSLMSLTQFNHFPKLYGYDGLSIYMSYCGEKITSQNIPDNWHEQVIEIQKILQQTRVNPDDMIQRNICVLNGIINIIDFGLNTEFTTSIEITINKLYKLLENLYKKKYSYRSHNIRR